MVKFAYERFLPLAVNVDNNFKSCSIKTNNSSVNPSGISIATTHFQTHLRPLFGGGEPLQEPLTQTKGKYDDNSIDPLIAEDRDAFPVDSDGVKENPISNNKDHTHEAPAPVLISDSTVIKNSQKPNRTQPMEDREKNIDESESDDDDADLSFTFDITKALSNTKLQKSVATASDFRSQQPVSSLPLETQIKTPEKDSIRYDSELPRVKLNKVLSILNNQLDSLGEDGDKKQILLEAIGELGKGPKSARVVQIFQNLQEFVGGVFETTSTISQLEKDRKGHKDKLCTLEKDLNKAWKTKTRIESFIRDGSQGKADLEYQIKSLKAQLKELERNEALFNEAMAKGNKELRSMDFKCYRLQQDKEKLSQEYNDLSRELSQAQDTHSKLIENQNHLRTSIKKILV